MAELFNKENFAPDHLIVSPAKFQPISPLRATRKGRSKSIGPGAEGFLESPKSASPNKNRRKSSFAPPKSILPSKEDEAKRREARRKSLANRRVSFAPEATLHTWDVIEYMREATSSSTSSENTRRASHISEEGPTLDSTDIPATPEALSASPAHDKKRRRSSAIPPLNFNDPDEYLSSSPASGSSPIDESGEDSIDDEDGAAGSDGDEDTAMSLASMDNTGDLTLQSNASTGTSDSSGRLAAALDEASERAGTLGIKHDEFGYQSDESPDDAEEPRAWSQHQGMLTPMAKNLIALQDQENVNPFSPAFRAHSGTGRPSTIAEEEEESGMEMTRPVGGIVEFREPEPSAEDVTMDFTQMGGKIYQNSPIKGVLKRRRSTTNEGSPMTFGSEVPQAGQEELGRPSKRRRSSADRSSIGDGTMDFTAAFGAINNVPSRDATMEFTTAIGNIVRNQSPLKVSRRQSVRRRRSSAQSTLSNEQTMEFTTAIGGINKHSMSPAKPVPEAIQDDEYEDMSMEFTGVIGTVAEQDQIPARPTTPRQLSSPLRTDPPTTPKDQGRFKEAEDLSAKKLLTPVFVKQIEPSSGNPITQASRSPATRKIATPKRRLSASPGRNTLQVPPPQLSGTRTPSISPKRSPRLQGNNGQEVTPTPSSGRRSESSVQATPRTPNITQLEVNPVKSLQSPFKESKSPATVEQGVTPAQTSPQRPQQNMLDNIRSMSTPRKDGDASPLKRLKEMTPKKTPVQKTRTPRATATPRVQFSIEQPQSNVDETTNQLNAELVRSLNSGKGAQKVKLGDFLNAAGIKFMDLTATKRRYTAAPTPAKLAQARLAQDAEEDQDSERLFEEAVAAGACTVPELDLYQHSCRELKRYMTEGKTFVKQLEADVAADPPPFMQAYMSASAAQRGQLDIHMTDMKTRARLQSKEIWYGWRSQLLKGLEDGLRNIERGLEADEDALAKREVLLQDVLPAALAQRDQLQEELQALEEAAAQYSADDRGELEAARAQLSDLDTTVAAQQELLAGLQAELEEQERLAELYVDSKAEALAAIEKANRVKEACRGISREEVAAYQASVSALEASTGWTVTTATPTSLTLTYRSALQLFFHPSAFAVTTTTNTSKLRRQSRSPGKKATAASGNRPISLSYVAEDAPLSTERRFFLQLLRAQLQMLEQAATPVRSLLALVGGGWDLACSAAETVRRLALEERVEVGILSDETLGVTVDVLLPAVQTKVVLAFEMGAAVVVDGTGDEGAMRVEVETVARGRVVYGEQYKEGKMGEFVGQRMGRAMEGAETAVRELRGRLERTGRKG